MILLFAFYLPVSISLIAMLPVYGWWQDELRNWALYLLAWQICGLLLFQFGAGRKLPKSTNRLFRLLLVFLVIYYGQFFYKFFWPTIQPSQMQQLRVLFLRVDQNSNEVEKELIDLEPDVVLVSSSKNLQMRFPEIYKVQSVEGKLRKVELLTKLEFNHECDQSVIEPFPPGLLTCLILPTGRQVGVFGFDTAQTGGRRQFYDKRITIRRLATSAKHNKMDFLVLAGMGSDVMTKAYNFLIEEDGVKDAAWGYGLQKTWHSSNPFSVFNLDHILYRGEFNVIDFVSQSSKFSDSKYLLVDFGILNAN